MKASFAVLAVAVPFLTALPAAAQVHEEVTVEVVDVPVYVFHGGKPIADLTKDDFELFVNGKRQQIDYFDRIDFEAAAGQPAVAPNAAVPSNAVSPLRDPRDRRLFLLLFDLAYNRPAPLARAQKAAVAMVDHALPADFFAVATYSSRGANFVIPFTRDREVIRRAVLKLSPSSAHDSLAISITDAERQTTGAWVPITGGGGAQGHASEDPILDIMAGFIPEERQRAKNHAQSQLDDISRIAARLAGLEGSKHVILMSEGFSSGLFSDGDGRPDAQMMDALHSMARSFHTADALLHTLDLGVVGGDVIELRRQTAPTANPKTGVATRGFDESKDETLFMFAAQTGGQFLHWTNDYTGALADLSTTSSAGYRLGFRPVNVRKGANSIEVKLRNVPASTKISFRKGFSWPSEPAKSVDSLRLADIIQNDIPQSGTPPAFAFLQPPYLDVVVPVRKLAAQVGTTADGDVLLYVFDEKGAAVDYREKKISIPLRPAGDVVVREKLSLAPGKYVAKSLLRVGTSLGFAKVTFTIPERE